MAEVTSTSWADDYMDLVDTDYEDMGGVITSTSRGGADLEEAILAGFID